LDETAELDHKIPLHEGGTDEFDNSQLLCCPCHKKKSQDEEQRRIAAVRAAIAKRQTTAPPRRTEAEVLEGLLVPVNDFDFSQYVFLPPDCKA
jgi:hypothetical protein